MNFLLEEIVKFLMRKDNRGQLKKNAGIIVYEVITIDSLDHQNVDFVESSNILHDEPEE